MGGFSGHFGFVVDAFEQAMGVVLNGVAGNDGDQRAGSFDFECGLVGVEEGLGEGVLGAVSGLEVGGYVPFLGLGDLWCGVIDDGEGGGPGTEGIAGGDGFRAAVEVDQGWGEDSAGGSVTGRSKSVVCGLGIEVGLRQGGEDGRRESLVSGGKGDGGGELAHLGAGHGGDMGELGIDDDVSEPEEDAIVVRGCAGSDLLFGPTGLAVEGVCAIRTAGIDEAECLDFKGFAIAGVVGGKAVGVAVFLEGGGICGVGLGGIGEGLGGFGFPSCKDGGEQRLCGPGSRGGGLSIGRCWDFGRGLAGSEAEVDCGCGFWGGRLLRLGRKSREGGGQAEQDSGGVVAHTGLFQRIPFWLGGGGLTLGIGWGSWC